MVNTEQCSCCPLTKASGGAYVIPQVWRNHSGHYRCFDEANPHAASSIHLLVRPLLAWPGYRARHVVFTGAPSPLIDAQHNFTAHAVGDTCISRGLVYYSWWFRVPVFA